MDYYLKCTKCSAQYTEHYRQQICRKCGSILEIFYKRAAMVPASRKFWDYEHLLPKSDYGHYEVGGTELVESNKHKNLFLKLELQNPTKSFKDRGSVIEVAKAREYKYKEIAVASTGNMAYSLAYYSKILGIKAHVFISRNANPDKVRNILMTHDAVMHRVDGDFSKAQVLAEKFARAGDAFLAGDYCYRKEGQKTIMYEVAAQLNDITHMIVPVGNATLISGIFKALLELKASNRIETMPHIIAVQAERCSPFVKAAKAHRKIKYERPRTGADAIAVGFPTFGQEAMEAIKKTKGSAIAVSEKEMKNEQEALYESQGILAELAGVAALAAFKKLKFRSQHKVVAIISGGNI